MTASLRAAVRGAGRVLRGAWRALRRTWRGLRRQPLLVQVPIGIAGLVALGLAVNWTYQVVRKPSELFFPVSGRLHKTPTQTWNTYERLFRKHSTSVITPELLAALAQAEAMGNPVARTYWRWAWSSDPFEIYRPASSSVGMYQMTDGTFAEARRYCIHNHVVVEQGAWYDWRSCWFNTLYTRVVPSHAIELTSAHLDRQVAGILARQPDAARTLEQKQDLAAMIHLCGPTGALRRVRAQLSPRARCGAHDLEAYLERVRSMRRFFAYSHPAGEP